MIEMEKDKIINMKKEELVNFLKGLIEEPEYFYQAVERAIIDTGRPDLYYEFALNYKNANVKELEKVIINNLDPKFIRSKI